MYIPLYTLDHLWKFLKIILMCRWLFESTDAEPMDMEDQLYMAPGNCKYLYQ